MSKIAVIYVFKHGDWCYLRRGNKRAEFPTEAEAKKFVREYRDFGADYSRVIRQGDWQVIMENA